VILSSADMGTGMRIGIAVSRFNSFITERLLQGAQRALRSRGFTDEAITVAYVPGAFELPLAAKVMAETRAFDAVVCLGCVIRGETAHFEHVASAARDGILQAGLETRVPIIFGVLTTDTVEQARSRAGELQGNKGAEAALAAIEIAHVLKQFRSPE
jgi:6,7-dimethyl-8-ribityllumazine synthase